MHSCISWFHFRIKNKYLILRKCLLCDFLQIVIKRSRKLHMDRCEYLSTLGGDTYVSCQSLISHGCLRSGLQNLRVYGTATRCKKILHFHQIIGTASYLLVPQEPFTSCKPEELDFKVMQDKLILNIALKIGHPPCV